MSACVRRERALSSFLGMVPRYLSGDYLGAKDCWATFNGKVTYSQQQSQMCRMCTSSFSQSLGPEECRETQASLPLTAMRYGAETPSDCGSSRRMSSETGEASSSDDDVHSTSASKEYAELAIARFATQEPVLMCHLPATASVTAAALPKTMPKPRQQSTLSAAVAASPPTATVPPFTAQPAATGLTAQPSAAAKSIMPSSIPQPAARTRPPSTGKATTAKQQLPPRPPRGPRSPAAIAAACESRRLPSNAKPPRPPASEPLPPSSSGSHTATSAAAKPPAASCGGAVSRAMPPSMEVIPIPNPAPVPAPVPAITANADGAVSVSVSVTVNPVKRASAIVAAKGSPFEPSLPRQIVMPKGSSRSSRAHAAADLHRDGGKTAVKAADKVDPLHMLAEQQHLLRHQQEQRQLQKQRAAATAASALNRSSSNGCGFAVEEEVVEAPWWLHSSINFAAGVRWQPPPPAVVAVAAGGGEPPYTRRPKLSIQDRVQALLLQDRMRELL